MNDHPNALVFRYIVAHAPVTAAAIAAGLGLELAVVGRAIATLTGAGLIGVAGHDLTGEPLYSALDS